MPQSQQNLVRHIIRLSEDGDPPSMREIEQDDQAPSASLYPVRFDSYNEAVKRAGYEPRPVGGTPQYTREDLLYHIHRLATNDRPPSTADILQDPDAPSLTPYYRRFESYSAAVDEAGYEPRDNTGYSRARLINDIHRLADGHQPPSRDQIQAHSDVASLTTYCRYFGSYSAAVEEADYPFDN